MITLPLWAWIVILCAVVALLVYIALDTWQLEREFNKMVQRDAEFWEEFWLRDAHKWTVFTESMKTIYDNEDEDDD